MLDQVLQDPVRELIHNTPSCSVRQPVLAKCMLLCRGVKDFGIEGLMKNADFIALSVVLFQAR